MGQINPIVKSFNLPDGREVIIETGKLATQAHGSVVVKIGATMLFASVVSSHESKPDQSFFPLSVDYQEKFASVGRIPGNFFKRETRLSDYEILISRLVDRAVRPLFPDGYMNETQIIINLISYDRQESPDCYAALAASAALAVSDINFDGPISEVRVAKINGQYVVNPLADDQVDAELNIIVAATMADIMMVEGEAKECQEADLVEAIKVGHEAIKVQCQAQLDLAQLVGEKATVKRELAVVEENTEVKEWLKKTATDRLFTVCRGALDKVARKNQFSEISKAVKEEYKEEFGEEQYAENSKDLSTYFDKLKKETIRRMVLDESVRLDGRALDKVRSIWSEVDYLPAAHGSAIFNRGETQALMSLTLGTKMDQQMIDTARETYYDKFILHYNFPALSVGEIKPMRGPGRREVGHANLAARSLKQVLPTDSPYTIRLVSDILESNGSSSMATVCSGSLALMDAGIPIKAAVSGIAMGMISDGEKTAVLSDILGDEDAIGDMDFKVTGTRNGITACQMDIKIDGLPYELLEKALSQAREGRLHILDEMDKTISVPNSEMKAHAPRIEVIIIDKSYIGAVIGPGGKIIQKIQEESGAVITIEEKGNTGEVAISSNSKESLMKAREAIEKIVFVPTIGDIYDATVASIMPYGAFVNFAGKSGLLHVSEIAHNRINDVSDVLKEGDAIKVKLIGIDEKSGKMKLSAKALLPREEKPKA